MLDDRGLCVHKYCFRVTHTNIHTCKCSVAFLNKQILIFCFSISFLSLFLFQVPFLGLPLFCFPQLLLAPNYNKKNVCLQHHVFFSFRGSNFYFFTICLNFCFLLSFTPPPLIFCCFVLFLSYTPLTQTSQCQRFQRRCYK